MFAQAHLLSHTHDHWSSSEPQKRPMAGICLNWVTLTFWKEQTKSCCHKQAGMLSHEDEKLGVEEAKVPEETVVAISHLWIDSIILRMDLMCLSKEFFS